MNGEFLGLGRTYWVGIVLIVSASVIISVQGEIPQQWIDFVKFVFVALAGKSAAQKIGEGLKK